MTKQILFVLGGLLSNQVWAGEVRVAVAANFAGPMKSLSEAFAKQTGHTLKISTGSTGKFYAQIKNGAPLDVLLSADEEIPEKLVQDGLAVANSRFVYAIGQLALWSAQAGVVDDKGEVLRKGQFAKLAMADPKVAPYGLAAKQALQKLKLWDNLQGKLVQGESIAQTYQFVATHNAPLGFVALSQLKTEGSRWIVPQDLYEPLRQVAVQLNTAKDVAATQAWMSFLRGKQAQQIIQGYGYHF